MESIERYAKFDSTRPIPAFNSSVPRFGRFTGHPKLSEGRVINKLKGCDPCKYSPIDATKCMSHKLRKEPWTFQKDLEKWAKNLGYRNQSYIKNRKWRNSLLGPAWHDVKDYPKYEAACKDIGFGRARRFTSTAHSDNLPGPGTYYKSNPYKAPHGPHSARPSFEREHPCRFRDTVPPWHRGISSRTIIDKNDIAMKPKKIVSLRGPYDLFSVKRDNSSIISKTSPFGKKFYFGSWPTIPALILAKQSNVGTSSFKTSRKWNFGRNAAVDVIMCRRRPEEPDSTTYSPYAEQQVKQCKVPFNTSGYRPPNIDRSKLGMPSVSNYNVAVPSKKVYAHEHLFRSKVPRDISGYFLKKPENAF